MGERMKRTLPARVMIGILPPVAVGAALKLSINEHVKKIERKPPPLDEDQRLASGMSSHLWRTHGDNVISLARQLRRVAPL